MPAGAPYDEIADGYEAPTVEAGVVLEPVTQGDGPPPVVLSARWREPAG